MSRVFVINYKVNSPKKYICVQIGKSAGLLGAVSQLAWWPLAWLQRMYQDAKDVIWTRFLKMNLTEKL